MAAVLIAIGAVGLILSFFIALPMAFGPIFWLGLGMLTLAALVNALRELRANGGRDRRRVKIPDALFIASIAAWSILMLSIVVNALWVPSFKEVGHLKIGCYLTDALWFYVECRGFAFSGIVSFFLTIPYALWLGPVLLLWNPVLGIPLWFLLIFPAWYAWNQRRDA